MGRKVARSPRHSRVENDAAFLPIKMAAGLVAGRALRVPYGAKSSVVGLVKLVCFNGPESQHWFNRRRCTF